MLLQAKTKGSQKMTFSEFEKALELIAEKKVTTISVAQLCSLSTDVHLLDLRCAGTALPLVLVFRALVLMT